MLIQLVASYSVLSTDSVVTWRYEDKKVLIVIQRMVGKGPPEGQRQTPANRTQTNTSYPLQPLSVEGVATGTAVGNKTSVHLSDNVAYGRSPENIPPPPPYSSEEKSAPEYDYIRT